MGNDQPFLTIVTPVYNRAELLKVCRESLICQTDRDFEWIVVDDGSTDGTADVARAFPDSGFPMRLIQKENGGKHTALNVAMPYVRGKYVLILDSDDRLVRTAVEQIREGWNRYELEKSVGIVTFLKGRAENDPSCTAPDEDTPVDIMRYRRHCIRSSDCCEVIRAELFQKYPFPVFQGERFLSEGALWNRVSLTHQCVYRNRVIYLAEYLDGGLTKSGRSLRIRNPRGGMYTAELNMHRKNYLRRRLKNGLLFDCYGFFAGMTVSKIIRKSEHKGLVWLCMPGGWMLYHYWKRKYGG